MSFESSWENRRFVNGVEIKSQLLLVASNGIEKLGKHI